MSTLEISNAELASFGSRLLAAIIDGVILCIPYIFFGYVGPLLAGLLYYSVFESSPIQATLGKRALGIRVTSTNGETLTLVSAFVRYLVKLGSACLLFIGHFVALFTDRKQAVHDLVVDSIVVRGTISSTSAGQAWIDSIKSAVGKTEAFCQAQTDGKRPLNDRLNQLERLHELRQKGAITEEEYQREKQKLLD